MSWRDHDVENPLESQSYKDCMMALACSILGQPDVKHVETILKAPYILRWPIESSSGGGYEQKAKRPRTTYILESCVDLGGLVACGGTETHIEHPWHFEETKNLLLSAFTLAYSAMEEKRLNRVQCAGALVEIMDARRHSVLMPGCAQKLFQHDKTKDGFVARYQGCLVLRRDNKVPVDFVVEDQLTAKRVNDAMNFLSAESSSRSWVWDAVQMSKPSNEATLLEVTNAHVQSVINELGLTARKKPKDMSSGWSLYGLKGKVFSGLKADEKCSVSTMGLTNPAIGGIMTPLGELRLSRLTIDEFEKYVQLHR